PADGIRIGYSRARFTGQNAFARYVTYATAAFASLSANDRRTSDATAPPLRCAKNVSPHDAADIANSGAFSQIRRPRPIRHVEISTRRSGHISNRRRTKGSVTAIGFASRLSAKAKTTHAYLFKVRLPANRA